MSQDNSPTPGGWGSWFSVSQIKFARGIGGKLSYVAAVALVAFGFIATR